MVGLGNVDNTSDLAKPVSTATLAALNLKANLNNPTFPGTLTAPTINASSALQVSGTSTDTLYQQKAWTQAILPSATVNGAVTVTSQNGAAIITSVNRTLVGTYVITWSPALSSNIYLVQGDTRNAPGS